MTKAELKRWLKYRVNKLIKREMEELENEIGIECEVFFLKQWGETMRYQEGKEFKNWTREKELVKLGMKIQKEFLTDPEIEELKKMGIITENFVEFKK